MLYPEYMLESIKRVEETRERRLNEVYPRLSLEEAEEILHKFHPDFKREEKRALKVGPSKGMMLNHEVADIFESRSRIDPDRFNLSKVDFESDVLIIGGGGAGCASAIMASEEGANVLLLTKLRLGDANTMMAQGGIQAAVTPQDSPAIHYLDVMGGGHFDNDPKLVKALVEDAPFVIRWLENMGVMFDKYPDSRMKVQHGGGTSKKRMHAARDYTGAAIMKTLRDEVRNRTDKIQVMEFTAAIELVLGENGECAGAIAYNMETEEYYLIKAKCTIIATGGFGRLHIQGYPTTNHYGATADGLVIAYRAGVPLRYLGSVQYHPTGAVFPEQILGLLITEKVRGSGAQVVNVDGEQFVYPLEPRDIEASAIIRECIERNKGVRTPSGASGVWLDTPMIELKHGEGACRRLIPAMVRQYERFGIDIAKEPILTYPTLHYQNGGLYIIDEWGRTAIPNLFAAGEVTGGVHGTNRLMGNSLLDVNVFGRRAGKAAAIQAKTVQFAKRLSLEHVKNYHRELLENGIVTSRVSPILLPDYTPEHLKNKRLLQKPR
ncbi:MAG: FAD-dependent oxidoreductase [bacterium]